MVVSREKLFLISSLLFITWVQTELFAGQRAKVGLVLSGGGARGLAHIGVLKVLEKLHVPVDFVAGTSMGAIVGGLWASGMSASEIEQIVLKTDWSSLFKDQPPRKLLSFHQKQLSQTYLADLELGYKKGRFHLPQGLIAGQQLMFLLRRLTLPVSLIEDFNKLPVPFRCVATDIVTGKAVVLEKGCLPEALRASMSIPGIFSPVEKEGYLLVDGGLVCNLPVDLARQMGAEVIIAVDVSSPLLQREKLNSLVAISAQVMELLTRRNVEEQLARLDKEKDILISPDLGNISSAAFNRAKELISLGEKKAASATEKLRLYSLSAEEYQQYCVQHRVVPQVRIVPSFVEVEGTGKLEPEIVKRKLSVREGEMLNVDTLQRDMGRIYDLGEFELVDFRLKKKEGKEGLVLSLRSKSWGPNYLRFGFHLYDDFGQNNSYGLRINYTWSQLNRLGAYWENEFELGKPMKYGTEIFLPVSSFRNCFLAPRLELKQSVFDFYSGERATAEFRTTLLRAGMDFGWQWENYGEFRVGLEKGLSEVGPISGEAVVPGYNRKYAGFVTSLNLDQLDRAGFPRHGYNLKLNFFHSAGFLGADENYRKLSLSFQAAGSSGRHSLLGILQAGTSLGSQLPVEEQFALGGFFSLPGYEEGQLRNNAFGLARAIYYYQVLGLPSLLGQALYLGCSLETGNTWKSFPGKDYLWSCSLFLGGDTLFGPVYFGHGWSRQRTGNTFFYLGRTF